MSDDSRNASNIRLVSDQPLLGTEVFIEGQKVYGLTDVEYESNMEKPDQMTITFNVKSVNDRDGLTANMGLPEPRTPEQRKRDREWLECLYGSRP